MKISKEVPRSPVSRIPREVATRALFSPKLSGRSQRLFMRARSRVIDVERKEPKSLQESFCAKIKTLSLVQLGHRAAQIKHGISRLEKMLDDTTLESFRKSLEEALVMARYRLGWLAQEVEERTFNPERIDEGGN